MRKFASAKNGTLNRPPLILFSLAAQYENLGDLVINRLLVGELVKRADIVTTVAGVPDWYASSVLPDGGVKSRTLRLTRSMWGLLCEGVLARLHGRNVFLALSPGDTSTSRVNRARDLALWLFMNLVSARIFSVGLSVFRSPPSRLQTLRRAVQSGGVITVRDAYSRQFLDNHGVPSFVVPDLAFLLPVTGGGQRDRAIFSFRDMPAVPFERVMAAVSKLAAWCASHGLKPTVCWQVERDAQYCRRIAQAGGFEAITSTPSSAKKYVELCGVYDRAAVVVSNRLHVLLVAAACGAMPCALVVEEERKIRGVFADAGLLDCLIELAEGAEDRGGQHLAQILSSKANIDVIFQRQAARLDQFFDSTIGHPLPRR